MPQAQAFQIMAQAHIEPDLGQQPVGFVELLRLALRLLRSRNDEVVEVQRHAAQPFRKEKTP